MLDVVAVLSTAAILLTVNETADCCSLIKKKKKEGVFVLERFREGGTPQAARERGSEGGRRVGDGQEVREPEH